MSIKIYKDSSANAIFIEDANGVQFLNSLQASISGTDCNITDLAKNIELVSDSVYTEFIDENNDPYGNDSTEVCNALNAIFQASGTPTDNLPSITSSLTASLVEGETLNYELTADYGVGYEWDLSNVSGVTTVEGNDRKLVGGSGLSAGTYNIPVKAINYNGEDSETIVLTVDDAPYVNAKSLKFNNSDFLSTIANTSNPFYRASNGAGASDAWTLSTYFKGGSSGNSEQTILSFGGQDADNEGRVHLFWDNSANDRFICLEYGSNNNNITLKTPADSFTNGSWRNIIITYDGGTTGSSSGSINDYYGRFEIWINGVSQTLTTSNANYGFSAGMTDDAFYVAEACFGAKHLKNNSYVDEVALWSSDQTANVSDIYNSGTPHDLSALSSAPEHWWRMGDGDTYPTIQDNIGSLNFIMNNMTSSDIVSDVPS